MVQPNVHLPQYSKCNHDFMKKSWKERDRTRLCDITLKHILPFSYFQLKEFPGLSVIFEH